MRKKIVILHDVLMAGLGWPESSPHSGRIQAARALKNLVSTQVLEAGHNGQLTYYRLPGCTSTYEPHAQFISVQIAAILKLYPESLIRRECWIEPIHRRADFIALIINNNHKGLCVIVECLLNESDDDFRSKEKTWRSFDGALDYLTELFQLPVKVPSFAVIPVKQGQDIISLLPSFPSQAR